MKEARKLDVVLHGAQNLKKVNTSRMAAYVVAWIDPSVRVPSPMDKSNGVNPVWNSTLTIVLNERTLGQGMYLNLELLGHGLVSTKPIGFVSVNVSDLLQEGSKGEAVQAKFHDHPVMRRSGRQQGTISFELHLQESPTLMAIQEMIPKTSPTPIIRASSTSPAQIEEYDQHQQEQPARFQPHNNYGYSQEKTTPQNIAGDKFSRNDVVAPQNRRSTLANGLYPNTAPKNRVYAAQPVHDRRQEETSLLDSYFEIAQKSL
jgi:Ca2+-dependent lipid-binding protein